MAAIAPAAAAAVTPVVVPVAPRLEKAFDVESYFELNNPQLHVLDSSSGISVRKVLDLWESLGRGSTASSGNASASSSGPGSGAAAGAAAGAPAAPGKGGVPKSANSAARPKHSREEQIIPAATHKLTQALDAMLLACTHASKRIDDAFER
jgi:hypothetical protein